MGINMNMKIDTTLYLKYLQSKSWLEKVIDGIDSRILKEPVHGEDE